jgi:1,4-alpha-glucan branching enzyme
MHDTLDYASTNPLYRRFHHNQLTFSMMYAFSENFILALSHDEVVHLKRSLLGKMPGDDWQKFANLRTLFGYMYAHPGKKLLFMGDEWGQWGEWNHDTGLDWQATEWPAHQGLQTLIRDLNMLYRSEPALHAVDFEWQGFQWINADDANRSIFSWIRRGKQPDDFIVAVTNWTPMVYDGYLLGVPQGGAYREVLNSDATKYGGSNVRTDGEIEAVAGSMHGQPFMVRLRVPPLSVVYLKPVAQGAKDQASAADAAVAHEDAA